MLLPLVSAIIHFIFPFDMEENMIQLWARIIHRHRIERSETVEVQDGFMNALGELCVRMDIPRPLFLGKHEREWERFQQTAFTRDHFVESVPFDRLEIELFDSDSKKKKSQDPRNAV